MGGKRILEIGPGDSLFTAAIGRRVAARSVVLIDAGEFVRYDARAYAKALEELGVAGGPKATASQTAFLAHCNARYLTDGLRSLQSLDPGGIDVCFSIAVLEHVSAAEIRPMFDALFKALAPGGERRNTKWI